MVTESDAVKYLLDGDGGTRDVTFTPTTQQAVSSLFRDLLTQYCLESAYDNNGNDLVNQIQTDTSALYGGGGFVHAVFADATRLIRCLQVFLDWDQLSSEYCIEISFIPGDITLDSFTFDQFRDTLTEWNDSLNADDYFVRYENASWDLYDPNGLGVIFTRKQPPMSEPCDEPTS